MSSAGESKFRSEHRWTRRQWLLAGIGSGLAASSGLNYWSSILERGQSSSVFISKADRYDLELENNILQGFKELGVSSSFIQGKRILLKPNLVEPHQERAHINTHPRIIEAAARAFLSLGAGSVMVGEAPGHRRDGLLVFEESGVAPVLVRSKIPFMDLNNDGFESLKNRGAFTGKKEWYFPKHVLAADWVVSVAKMKTHHWASVTLSMKNCFGLMPGAVYGWPKNVLHHAGINQSIADINATLQPHFAIVDGIVGMEGDGPIMGDPVSSGVLVMGKNPTAVDATCCRLMEIDPEKIELFRAISGHLGPIHAKNIEQRGESIASLQRTFKLESHIAAHQNIRLT